MIFYEYAQIFKGTLSDKRINFIMYMKTKKEILEYYKTLPNIKEKLRNEKNF